MTNALLVLVLVALVVCALCLFKIGQGLAEISEKLSR